MNFAPSGITPVISYSLSGLTGLFPNPPTTAPLLSCKTNLS
ncbi:hypothetical protein [Tenacibaculum sp. C7A-26P2]